MNFLSENLSPNATAVADLSRKRARLLAPTAFAAALTMFAPPAMAQTWDGETDGDYLTGTNWDGDVTPAAGGAVVLDDGGLANQPTLGAGDTSTVDTVSVSDGTLTIDGDLTATTGFTITGGLVQVGAAGSMSGDAETSGPGTLTLDGSLTGNVTNGGTLNINATSVVIGDVTSSGTGTNDGEVTGTLEVTAGTFDNNGAVDGATTVSGGALNLNTGTNLADAAALTVNGGTVNVNASDEVGSLAGTGGTVDVDTGQTLTAGGSNGSTSYAGVISGAGTLTKAGTGTLTLTGVSTQTGPIDVNGGTLAFSGSGTTASTDIDVAAGATLTSDGGSFATTTAIELAGTGTLTLTGNEFIAELDTSATSTTTLTGATLTVNSGTSTLAGLISGVGGAVTNAGGAATMTFANTYTGATSVTGGSLSITGAGSIASTAVSVSAGTLTTDSDALAAGATVTVSGTGTFTSSGTDSFTAITQTGGTVNGSGVLTLSGAFDQSGGTTGGTVDINAATFTQSGGATIASGTTVTSSGAQSLQSGTIAGSLDGAGAITAASGTTGVSGTITNAASLTVSGGTLNLTSAGSVNTSTNAVSVTSGTLTDDGNGIADDETVTVSSPGIFTLTGNDTIAGLQGNGTTNLTGATLTTGNAATNTYSGSLSGTGGLTVQGTGTTALTGAISYSGTTTVISGTLDIETFGTTRNIGDMVVNGGTLALDNAILNVDSLSGSGGTIAMTTTSGEAVLFFGSDNSTTTYSGGITGDTSLASLIKEGTGTTTLSGTINTSGSLFVNDGTLALSGTNTFTIVDPDNFEAGGIFVEGTGKLRLLSNGAAGGAGGRIITTGSVISYADTVNSATPIVLNSDDTELEVIGALESATQSGVISEIAGPRPLEKIGAGRLIFAAANTYTGVTTISAGTLELQGGAAIVNTGEVTLADVAGVTLVITNSETIGSLNGGGATGGAVTIASLQTLTTGDAGNDTFAGIISGPGGLTKEGTGIFTLSGANTYFGTTTVNNGTLQAGDANALSPNSAMVINAPGIVQLNGFSQTVASLNNGGTVDMNNGAAGSNTTDVLTVSGAYTGSGTANLILNADLDTALGTSDSLLIGGASSGTTTVNFTNSQFGALTNDVLIVSTTDGNLAVTEGTGLQDVGLVQYDLQEIGNNWFITSSLNLAPIGAIVGGISTAQSLINTGVNRPSSAFVTTPIDVKAGTCAPGGYGRFFGGAASADSTTTSPVSSPATSEVDLTYGGAQIGVDFGCFNLGGTGAAVNVGVLGGINIGQAEQNQLLAPGSTLLGDNDFNSRYAGIYATFVKGSFFADAQVTHDWTDFEITSSIVTGGIPDLLVNNQTPESQRTTVSGSAGYAFALNDVSIVPSVGFAYSRTKTDTIGLVDNGGTLTFQDLDTIIGFASVAVAKTIILSNETSAIQLFATGTVYNDFGDDQVVVFDDVINNPVATTTENIGTFGELSLGLNYRAILEQTAGTPREVSATMRGDLTFSDRLLGYRLTLQGRVQF